jgi:hypothetical protein
MANTDSTLPPNGPDQRVEAGEKHMVKHQRRHDVVNGKVVPLQRLAAAASQALNARAEFYALSWQLTKQEMAHGEY